jgi:nitric oxide synthase-interacting protein
LLPARDPVSCPSHGHLFCRECAVNNLLAQNKELKRLKKEAERRRLEDDEERVLEDAEKKARDLDDFERVQAGIRGKGAASTQNGVESSPKGVKRKLENEDDSSRQAGDQGNKAKRRQSEQNGSNEESSFWIPSKIPDNKKADFKAIKHHPTCPAAAADRPHDFTLKRLVTVNFTDDKPSDANASTSDSPSRTCPSCNKALSNSTKAILAKPCGHVLCKPCSDKFQQPPAQSAHDGNGDQTIRCYVCSEDITPGRKRKVKRKDSEKGESVELGMVEISSEGTGFAGGGKNMVKKEGVAFQC